MGRLRPVPSTCSSASFTTRIATASRLSPAGLQAPRSGESLQQTYTAINGQYNSSHSIISYTTTDSDHPDYTLLSAHPLCPLTFILLRGELCGSLPWKAPTVASDIDFPCHSRAGWRWEILPTTWWCSASLPSTCQGVLGWHSTWTMDRSEETQRCDISSVVWTECIVATAVKAVFF
jgi:hypothetical protein